MKDLVSPLGLTTIDGPEPATPAEENFARPQPPKCHPRPDRDKKGLDGWNFMAELTAAILTQIRQIMPRSMPSFHRELSGRSAKVFLH